MLSVVNQLHHLLEANYLQPLLETFPGRDRCKPPGGPSWPLDSFKGHRVRKGLPGKPRVQGLVSHLHALLAAQLGQSQSVKVC